MNVDTNVTSFEWPVTDTVVQYSVITTIYIFFYEKPTGDSASMSLKWLLDCILLWEHIVVINSFGFSKGCLNKQLSLGCGGCSVVNLVMVIREL